MDTRFGFIHDKLDIKILILYVLKRLPDAVDINSLADMTLCDDGISYFDFADCVADLVSTGHVKNENDKYMITDKGRTNGAITESVIPYSVRIKAEKSTALRSAVMKRDAMISASHELRKRGGCTVSLSMADGISPVISMDLLVASEEQAADIEQRFRKNAEEIYSKVIGILLEDN